MRQHRRVLAGIVACKGGVASQMYRFLASMSVSHLTEVLASLAVHRNGSGSVSWLKLYREELKAFPDAMVAVRGLSLVWALGILALCGAQGQDDHRAAWLRGLQEQQSEVQEAADPEPADEQPGAEDAVAEEQMQVLQLEKAMKNTEHKLALSMAVWLVVQTVLVACVGLLYTSCFQSKPSPDEVLQPERAQEGFRYGLFDGCCHSLRICCCSFWCLPVRWADTASSSQIKFLGFGTAVFLFQLLYVLSRLPSVFISFMAPSSPSEPSPMGPMILLLVLAVLFHVLLLVMLVRNRQRVRSQYGLPHGTCSTCTCDVLVWIFCCCCAGMQEALQVEYVGEPVEISEGKSESKRSTMCP